MDDKPIWPVLGYAPGNYSCTCWKCEKHFLGDKLACECPDCTIQQLRTDLANAGAVIVEACAQAVDARGQQEQRNFGLGRETQNFYRARDLIRTLSTLSPIASAARVLLAQTEAANDHEIGPWLRALAEQEKADG